MDLANKTFRTPGRAWTILSPAPDDPERGKCWLVQWVADFDKTTGTQAWPEDVLAVYVAQSGEASDAKA